jgi:eukaryotic-like serine/threonine-protein kinase
VELNTADLTTEDISETANLTTNLDLTLDLDHTVDFKSTPTKGPVISQDSSIGPKLPGYRLEEIVGQGVFGEVWRALQLSTHQLVAVKIFHQESLSALSELRHLEKLGSHPYLLNILDAQLEHSPPYIVTSLLKGSLSNWMKQHAHACNFNDSVWAWLLQASIALSYAHRRGLCHGNLKPSNFLLDSQDVLRISGFGHSSGQDSNSSRQSGLDALLFRSPEALFQGRGGESPHSPASDIYSLGATFYYLLTSFHARISPRNLIRLENLASLQLTARELWAIYNTTELVPILNYNPDVDRRLAIVIERCLSIKTQRRYLQTVDLVTDLEQHQQIPTGAVDEYLYSLRCLADRWGL